MNLNKWIAAVSLPVIISACAATPGTASAPSWESVFDGHSLSGWTPKIVGQPAGQDADRLFRVEGGAITVSYDAYSEFSGQFGHLFYTEELSDYRLRFEYKFFGDQLAGGPGWAFMNSGVMVHAQAPGSMQIDQAFPVSVEAQLLGKRSSATPRTTANICTPGTHISMQGEMVTRHCINSGTEADLAGIWVEFEIEVRGGALMRLLIAGEEAFRLETPIYDTSDRDAIAINASGPVTHGYFALQAESHPVAFRNIQLLRLDTDK
jgi:3-keto-disaccharide hydrolase